MKIRQISLQSPAISLDTHSFAEKIINSIRDLTGIIKEKLLGIYQLVLNFVERKSEFSKNEVGYQVKTKRGFKFSPFNNKLFNNKKFVGSLLVIIIVPLLFVIVGKLANKSSNKEPGDNRVEVKGAISTTDVRREFTFPLNNAEGEEISKIKYMIERAELKDEIITDGKRATAVKGRMFLILILKITNQYDKSIKINTKDYVRLSVNGNEEELLAPETHNDPVEIQAISTKFTRVGFIVNDTDKDFILHVGQIRGDKEKVDLDLK